MKGIIELHKVSTDDLAKELKKTAAVSGDECWLFLPEKVDGKVCLVAHIDTVFDDPKDRYTCLDKKKPIERPHKNHKSIFFDKKQQVLWSPKGLGADDRAGVWTCLNLFQNIPEPHRPIVLLTDGEESGGTGAREAVLRFGEELQKANFFIELDRRGKGESVFYNFEPLEFVDYIEQFGFTESTGSFSDISFICPSVGRCGVNLSIGYHNAHSKTEYLNLKHMKYTYDRVVKILQDNTEKQQTWELTERRWMDEFEDWDCRKCKAWLTYSDIENGICPYCGDDLTYFKEVLADPYYYSDMFWEGR